MIGTTLTFKKDTKTGVDDFNNPVLTTTDIDVEDCLIAPITEPSTAREQQAYDQNRVQVRIHLPKAYTGDVSNSNVDWDGKTFRVDNDSVVFMEGNTPTRWNRYFRAELVSVGTIQDGS